MVSFLLVDSCTSLCQEITGDLAPGFLPTGFLDFTISEKGVKWCSIEFCVQQFISLNFLTGAVDPLGQLIAKMAAQFAWYTNDMTSRPRFASWFWEWCCALALVKLINQFSFRKWVGSWFSDQHGLVNNQRQPGLTQPARKFEEDIHSGKLADHRRRHCSLKANDHKTWFGFFITNMQQSWAWAAECRNPNWW